VIWSAQLSVIRKLLRLGFQPTPETRRRDGRLHGCEFRLPLASFRWGLKRRAARKTPLVPPERAADGRFCDEQALDGPKTA